MKKFTVLADYNPNVVRTALTAMLYERFYNLFVGNVKIEGPLDQYEKAAIYERLWRFGSFAVSKAKVKEEFSFNESGLVFTPYTVSRLSLYQFPYKIKNAPLEKSPAVEIRKVLTVGEDVVIVYWSPYARKNIALGVKKTASRYVKRIVRALMTCETNLLLHKLPFLIECEEAQRAQLQNAISQIFADFPAVFVSGGNASKLDGKNLTTPYIVDRLSDYVKRVENEFLDELGIDNSKGVSKGQDRLLLDEVNANNNVIKIFKESHIETLNEGFKEVEKLFGVKIEAKSLKYEAASVHEEINGGSDEDPEDPGENGNPEEEESNQ